MLFHAAEFFLLFDVTFFGYWVIKQHRLRNLWLLSASVGFYGSWNLSLVLVVLFSAAFDFIIAQRIEAAQSPKLRHTLLIVSIVVSMTATKPKNETDQAEHLLFGARKLRKRLRDFEIGGISAQALEHVIGQYHQLGTQIILIGPPVSSPYRRFYEKTINHKFHAYMKQLEKTYSASYYDYRARLPDNLFSSVSMRRRQAPNSLAV